MSTAIEDIHFGTHGPALAEKFYQDNLEVFAGDSMAQEACCEQTILAAIESILAYQGAHVIGAIFLLPFGRDCKSLPTFAGPLVLPAYRDYAIQETLLIRAVTRMMHRIHKRHFAPHWLKERAIDLDQHMQGPLQFAYPGQYAEEWEICRRTVAMSQELQPLFRPMEVVSRN